MRTREVVDGRIEVGNGGGRKGSRKRRWQARQRYRRKR